MKVKYEHTIEYKVLQHIEASTENVFLREEFTKLGAERQVSRAIKALIRKEKITKLGYGIYAKLSYSKITNSSYLNKGFLIVAREALTKLGIKWDISEAEKAYNTNKSQQVPVNPPTRLLSRFRRKIAYKGMELRFE